MTDIPGPTRHRAEYLDRHSLLVADGTAQSTTNSTAFMTVLSHTVEAGLMGPNGQLCVRVGGRYLNNSAASHQVRIEVSFGGTIVFDEVGTLVSSADEHAWDCGFTLFNKNSLSSQEAIGNYAMGQGAGVVGIGNVGQADPLNTTWGSIDPAVNTANDQTLLIRIKQQSTTAGVVLTFGYVRVEMFRSW